MIKDKIDKLELLKKEINQKSFKLTDLSNYFFSDEEMDALFLMRQADAISWISKEIDKQLVLLYQEYNEEKDS